MRRRSAAGLSHPNIVSIYDRGEADGSYFIVMEYVEGRTLKELIVTRGACPIPVAISYTRQILAALRYAHRNGIIHRDIKPHNVIVDREGRVKVADFGIARAGASQMTEAGSIIGTAQYLSPEQARGAPVEESSDLYSTGIVLYELLTGTVPFTGETPVEIAMKHLSQPPEPPSATPARDPHDLDLVVLRALAKEPADRYRSAAEMDRDLELVARGEPVGQETETAATVVLSGAGAMDATDATQIAARSVRYGGDERYRAYDGDVPRRRAWWPWLLALGLLIAAAIGGWLRLRQRPEPDQRITDRRRPAVHGSPGGERRRPRRSDGFQPKVERLPNPETAAGVVFEQEPREGTKLENGSIVVLRVSTGKKKVSVPDVRGLSQEQAVTTLTRAGLETKVVAVNSPEPEDSVTAQAPAPGEVVVEGAEVRINVLEGPEADRRPERRRSPLRHRRGAAADRRLRRRQARRGLRPACRRGDRAEPGRELARHGGHLRHAHRLPRPADHRHPRRDEPGRHAGAGHAGGSGVQGLDHLPGHGRPVPRRGRPEPDSRCRQGRQAGVGGDARRRRVRRAAASTGGDHRRKRARRSVTSRAA